MIQVPIWIGYIHPGTFHDMGLRKTFSWFFLCVKESNVSTVLYMVHGKIVETRFPNLNSALHIHCPVCHISCVQRASWTSTPTSSSILPTSGTFSPLWTTVASDAGRRERTGGGTAARILSTSTTPSG